MADKRKRITGNESAQARGLVPVSLLMTPEEREEVRRAAAATPEHSMSRFARKHVVEAARKVLQNDGVKKSGK
jgi:uncharacterized protein (DUF1778 family)